MVIANYIAFILVLIGGINWGLVGMFKFDLVTWMSMGYNGWAIAIYVIIFLATVWLIISPIISHGMIDLGCQYKKKQQKKND